MKKDRVETKVSSKLTDKDLQKASLIFNVPELEMRKLNDYGLLNSEFLKHEIIRQDYKNIKLAVRKRPEFNEESILVAVKREHHIQSILEVRDIVNNNVNKNMTFCKNCGKRISKRTARQTQGFCHECMADFIEL